MTNTFLEVDLNKVRRNVDKIRKFVGYKEIMPVVKANAYGTYLNTNLDFLNQFHIVGVARVDEAEVIRKIGYKKDIFLLNQPSIFEVSKIMKYDIIVGLSEKQFLYELHEPIRVHLEIETGMNRTGIKIEDLEDFIKIVKEKNLMVEGVYTHLSCADEDSEYTLRQLDTFKKAALIVKEHFQVKYIHSSDSNGLLNFDDGISNLVRPGIIMYGYESYFGCREKIDIEPITLLKSRITYLKEIDEGESIGYGRSFISSKRMKVATIPIGYADGYPRVLSNKGEVLVNGNVCKIIGNICMDSCMVDVTGIDVHVGDTVYLWDNCNILVEDIANKCNTISYEILSTISSRVERVFIS